MRYDFYINGQLCDLDNNSLIVITYTMEQLSNPTAVKNSYSHEVELPSTERNDKIFNHFYRNDYRVGVANFAPLENVPFTIYNELGELLENGYIKLAEVKIDTAKHIYKVVLYGGLGNFFYTLGYNKDGSALQLGDLQYFSVPADEDLLDLRIDRGTVGADGAWGRLAGENGRHQFDVINFAPTYQGKPSGGFDTKTALFIGRAKLVNGVYEDAPSQPIYGIDSAKSTNKMYKRKRNGVDTGYRISLVKLENDYTEWQTKDLRSYLQRPVLSIRKFIEAVQRRASEQGYTLNLDNAFFNDTNPYYNNTWITLASLQNLSRPKKEIEAKISEYIVVNGETVQVFPLTVTMPTATEGYEYGSTFNSVSMALSKLSIGCKLDKGTKAKFANNKSSTAWFLQVVGEDAYSNIVAYSDVNILVDRRNKASATSIAKGAKYTPLGGSVAYSIIEGYFNCDGAIAKFSEPSIDFKVNVVGNPVTWSLRIEKRTYDGADVSGKIYGHMTIPRPGGYIVQSFWQDITAGEPASVFGTATISANESIRSGVQLSKRVIMDIGKTPLDVLLGYCKLFGLVWHYEARGNTVSLFKRTTFYDKGKMLDWEGRIDRSREAVIKPFEFDKRFYDFELETTGEWAEAYKKKYGKTYGSQRVNTGYAFDSEAKNLLDGNALKGGAEVLEQGEYFLNITQDNKVCPAVFLDGGKYTLYNTSGKAVEYDVVAPTPQATISYMSEFQGYDAQPKLQAHTDGKLDEEGGTLLLYAGNIDVDSSPYKGYLLTDDVAEMGLLNDGNLCWVLEGSVYGKLSGDTIPKFVRTGLGVSLDMGAPQELDNPNADEGVVQNTIYSQYWRDYLADRYNTDSRVCICYVDLRGLQVNNALFRNFYYFDNAVWVLNKISNYSMTTVGTTQCEFVKVQDMRNYKGE